MLFVVRKTRLWPLLGLVLAAGCKKNATETAAPADGGGATQHEPRTLESLESELAERNAELRVMPRINDDNRKSVALASRTMRRTAGMS